MMERWAGGCGGGMPELWVRRRTVARLLDIEDDRKEEAPHRLSRIDQQRHCHDPIGTIFQSYSSTDSNSIEVPA